MRSRSSVLKWLIEPERPGLGLDLRDGELSLVRLAEKRGKPELDLCVTSPLPPECLSFKMLEPNILDAPLFRSGLENVLLRSGAGDAKRIALTLPDLLARITILQIPDAPRASDELEQVLRFRLKKSIPFDIEDARLAFERIPAETPTFLTGVMLDSVVAQYEEALAELGFHTGLVLPASMSLLQLLEPVAERDLAPGADYFFVNVESRYFTVVLVRNRETTTLFRTLGLRASETPERYTEDDLLTEIIPTAIYYREKLQGASLERVYYRSLRPDFIHLREVLEEQFEVESHPFDLKSAVTLAQDLQMEPELADSVGAAAGAALGRVA